MRSSTCGREVGREYDIKHTIAKHTNIPTSAAKPRQTPDIKTTSRQLLPMFFFLLPLLLIFLPLVLFYLTKTPTPPPKKSKMVEHEEEPKRFSPKVPVQLDPPKYDPIDAEELAKCDGITILCLRLIEDILSVCRNRPQPPDSGRHQGYRFRCEPESGLQSYRAVSQYVFIPCILLI